ncbi:hypothetical protein N826_24595 [Skermanella aerolata KACC 11604]|nr:hypothetical protein N826_24595 [Skermanella aerolata KACC 11604]
MGVLLNCLELVRLPAILEIPARKSNRQLAGA